MKCTVKVCSVTWDIMIIAVLTIGTLIAEGISFLEILTIITFCFGLFQGVLQGCKKIAALILVCTVKCALSVIIAYQTYDKECETCPQDKSKTLVGSFLWASVALSAALSVLGTVSSYKNSNSLDLPPIAA